jgi:hypothetical protein
MRKKHGAIFTANQGRGPISARGKWQRGCDPRPVVDRKLMQPRYGSPVHYRLDSDRADASRLHAAVFDPALGPESFWRYGVGPAGSPLDSGTDSPPTVVNWPASEWLRKYTFAPGPIF